MNNIYLISLTCFLASLAFPNQLQAQETGTIKGLIQDEQGNPASNINIRLTTQPNARKSDHNGVFVLHNLPFGDHQLIFTGIGFQPDTILISLTELQKEVELPVHLKDSDDQLQEVVVMGRKKQSYVNTKSFIGSKIESKITEIPQTISTFTKESA